MARRALGPATLRAVQAVRACLADVSPPGSLLVACSGGADSLALAAATVRACDPERTALAAAVVDHGLQAGSASQAARTRDQLLALGCADVSILTVQVDQAGQGPEGAAREARYAALDELADQLQAEVLLGHTRDDQAETVLLGLLRGSGTRSLAGMAARSGRFRRPLLDLRRTETEAVCAELGLQPWCDPHNVDPAYARSRLRTQVMPVLVRELGDQLVDALARTAQLARDDADLLDRLADDLATSATEDGRLRCAVLMAAPQALRSRVVRGWLRDRGAQEPGAGHVRSVLALVTDWHGQGPVQVPGLQVARHQDRLCVED